MAFSTAYTSVTWTAGDIITEAKLDSMVANDQAYDSHAAEGIELDETTTPSTPSANTIRLYAKDVSGVSSLHVLDDAGTETNVVSSPNGWTLAGETWTYASAATITVPSDATTKYNVGDKVRIKQGGGYKFFYIVAVAATTLTVTGGADYTVANAAITDNYYSKAATPLDFPHWFNWTAGATWDGTPPSGTTTTQSKFSINGRTLHFRFRQNNTVAGASNTRLTLPLPVDPDAIGVASQYNVPALASFGTGELSNIPTVTGRGSIYDLATPICYIDVASGAYKGAIVFGSYEI